MGEVNEGIPIWHGNECLMKMGSEDGWKRATKTWQAGN